MKERAQSRLAHFQELVSFQEQRQLDAELAYKQRIDGLRKDLRTTKQELLEDCVQGHAARAAAHASNIQTLKQQRQHLQDENNRLRASLQSAEEELTKVTLRVQTLENRTRRMSEELQNNERLKTELVERHLRDTVLEAQVEMLMDVEPGIMGQCILVSDADSNELDAMGSMHPSQTLWEELQNAHSDSTAPASSKSGIPESELQMAVLNSSNDCCGQFLSSDQMDDGDISSGLSFGSPAEFLTPTAGNADQLVRVLGHYLHRHYQQVVGGRQEQQHNPFSWLIKTSAIVTISWAAMTMQMLSVVETLVGGVESSAQIPT
ncbi:hypothetical protein EC968_006964 [Mortierella alpina]|nr:hypothetical protein EC968_006964 [Mortierella alpina]